MFSKYDTSNISLRVNSEIFMVSWTWKNLWKPKLLEREISYQFFLANVGKQVVAKILGKELKQTWGLFKLLTFFF